MAVNWERFSGSTDTFAIRMSFMPDPDGGVAAEPEESASWGALQIWVSGQNLCAHTDQAEDLQAAHWYLLTFLEWVVENWNPLLHEERLPNRNLEETAASALSRTRFAPSLATDEEALLWEEEWYDWRGRHAIRTARAGGLLPNVVFRRSRDSIEISWDDEPLAGTTSDFKFSSSSGAHLLSPDQVAKPLFDVTSAAVRHLAQLHPESARLQKVQESLGCLTDPAQEESRLGWLAGLRSVRPSESAAETGGRLREAWEQIRRTLSRMNPSAAIAALSSGDRNPLVVSGSCQAALLFGSVAPTVSEADIETLATLLIQQYDPAGDAYSRLLEYAEDCPVGFHSPAWEQGYELAEVLHDDIQSESYVDIDGFVESLGINKAVIGLDDPTIRACSLVGPQHVPTIALNGSFGRGTSLNVTRFSLAHELCHLLFDRSHGQRLAIASGPWAPLAVERRANAFAAMFLMPPHLIREAIAACPSAINTAEGITFISTRLRVSFVATVEHLYNLTFMTEEEKEFLLAQKTGLPR